MTGNGKTEGRIERTARLRWVPLTQMRVNPLAQRDLNQARVNQLAAVFDIEQMGAPTVSHRGGWYYLIDGQHRIAALKQWLGSWGDQQAQCWCYEGLSEAAEAEVFLKLNDTLAVHAFAKAGLDGPVIDGIGLLCQRYDGDLSEQRAVERLSTAHGGVSGLLNRAGQLRQSTGSAAAQCVAAAAVEVINRGSGGRKLPSWWRNGQ